MEIEGKRVAALVGDGFEESELLEPKAALEAAGAVVTIVGADDRALQKIRGKKGLDEGQSVKAEEIVADVTADDFDAILIPGGQSPDRNAGGLFRDQPVVNDGNWVTSRNPGDLLLFNRAILEKLATAGTAQAV